MPQPLHAFRHPGHLGEGGQFLVLPLRREEEEESGWIDFVSRMELLQLDGGELTFLAFLLWGVKQPMASALLGSWPLVGPSRRSNADGGISP